MCGSRAVPSRRSTRPGSRPRQAASSSAEAVEQQLQADADAEQVRALADRLADRLLEPASGAASPWSARRRPGPAPSAGARPRPSRDRPRRPRPSRPAPWPRAASAGCPSRSRRAPPSYRALGGRAARRGADRARTAARSASASALKPASTTWWSSSPSPVRCRLTRPARANESSRCGHRLAVTPPTGWPLSSRLMAETPRPPRSTTHSASASSSGAARVAEAADAGAVAERPVERLAERDAGVLDGVVLVHLEVAVDAQVEVHAGVERQRVEHVVEEADAGRDLRAAGAVDDESRVDGGLARGARDGRAPAPEGVVLDRHGLRLRRLALQQLGQRGQQPVGLGRRLHGRPDDAGEQRLVAERAHHAAPLAQPAERLVGVERQPEGHEHAGLGQDLDLRAPPARGAGARAPPRTPRRPAASRPRARGPARPPSPTAARSSPAAAAHPGRRRWPGRRARSPPAATPAPSPWTGCGRRSGSRAGRSGRRSRRRRTPGTPGRPRRGRGTTRTARPGPLATPPRRSGCSASRSTPAAPRVRAPAGPRSRARAPRGAAAPPAGRPPSRSTPRTSGTWACRRWRGRRGPSRARRTSAAARRSRRRARPASSRSRCSGRSPRAAAGRWPRGSDDAGSRATCAAISGQAAGDSGSVFMSNRETGPGGTLSCHR